MPKEFVQHTVMEPSDLAYEFQARRPRSDFPYQHKFVDVEGVNIAYVDEGEGDPIVFIHGAPESSYIWRNIMPRLAPYGRIVAPDLIGHGLSDKPDVEYKFADYIKYLDGFFEALNLKNMTFVIHDWGSVLGLHYAARHPDNVRGVAMMEALCAPFYPIMDSKKAAAERPGKAGAIHHYKLYKGAEGEDLAINQNQFMEQTMSIHCHRKLSQREFDTYRDPFRKKEWRKPLFMWAREVGLDGDVPFTDEAMDGFNDWLLKTEVPILDVYCYPGEVSEEYDVRWRAERLKNHETAFCGVGLHFVQEDQPEAVSRAIADWYRRNLAPERNKWFTDAQKDDVAKYVGVANALRQAE